MANLSSLESKLKAIQAAYTQLENGKLSQEELEDLVSNTKELYERAVILRYKAFEEKVFGVREVAPATVQEHLAIAEEVLEAEIPQLIIETEEESGDLVEFENEEEIEAIPSFDFSLFDDSAEVAKNEVLEENSVEHISVTSTATDEFGLHEERIVMEQTTVTPVAEENKSFITRFSRVEPGFSSQIGMSKLDTLIGSFGLNERLQYINELFDGSSEAFAEAIKAIDNLSSLQDALVKASTYANQFNWDNDSETVEEFVIKIKRRYA